MDDSYLMKTEIAYRSVIERIFSELKKESENEEEQKSLKQLKDVKIFKLFFK